MRDRHPPFHGRRAVLKLLAASAASCVAACSSDPVLSGAYRSVQLVTGGRPRYPVTRRQVDALPYAAMGVSVGGGPFAIVVLASYDGEDLHWISPDRVLLVTRRGRLVKSVGLPRDLRAAQFDNPDPVQLGLNTQLKDADFSYRMDLRPDDEFSVPVQSRFEWKGAETITILGQSYDTIRVEEFVHVPLWRWSATNRYWVDATTGFIWRSEQQFCPQTPPVTLETLIQPK